MEKGTVSVAFVAPLLAAVSRAGFNPDELLGQIGVAPDLATHPQARLPAATYAMLLRLVAQLLDDEFFGQDSRRMKPGAFAMLCHAVIGCRRLDRALKRTLQFYALHLDDLAASLERDGALALITLRPTDPDRPAGIFAQETLLMFVHRLACWLVNRRLPIRALRLAYPAPPHRDEYALLFCPDPLFDAPATALALDAAALALPVVRGPAALAGFLAVAPENLLVQYKDGSSLTVRILRQLESCPPADWPGFDDLARALNASASTLRRRLESEGQSYQGLKDRLRRDRAITLLGTTRLSVMEIGAELGFAEPSAFHRAFKKWTGTNPGDYRRRAGDGPGLCPAAASPA